MRIPSLLPYETIVRATSGEPEAMDECTPAFSKALPYSAFHATVRRPFQHMLL